MRSSILRTINEGRLVKVKRPGKTPILAVFCKYDQMNGSVWVLLGTCYIGIYQEDEVELVPEGNLTEALFS